MKAPRSRSRRFYGWLFATLILPVVLLTSCSSMLREHFSDYKRLKVYEREHRDDRDLSPDRMSEHGLYRAVIRPHTPEIPLNRLHQWTLHLEGPDGVAVNGAAIVVDGGMPEHGHGLPTKPRVTRALGNGDYLVEGMKFQMPGWWVVAFAISTPDGNDTVSFNLML